MKITAPPMMVAVALGLLGPGALQDVADLDDEAVVVREIDGDAKERAKQLWLEAREAFEAERDASR